MGLCEASDFTLSSLSVVLVIVEIFAHILTATFLMMKYQDLSGKDCKMMLDCVFCFAELTANVLS